MIVLVVFILLASLSRAEEFKNLAKWFPRLGSCLVLLPFYGVLFRSFVRIFGRTRPCLASLIVS